MNRPPAARRRVSACPPPNDLTQKVLRSKNSIEQHFQVMACCGIAVQVESAGVLECTPQLYESRSHHGEVGHHIVLAKERPERTHRIGDLAARLYYFDVGSFRGFVPVPCVFESFDLGSRTSAQAIREEHVVVLVTLEWR